MKRLAATVTWLILAAGLAGAQDHIKAPPVQKDMAERDGVWQVVQLTVNGDRATASEMKQTRVTNLGNSWVLTRDGQEVARGVSVIDDSAKPKTIDFSLSAVAANGEVVRGIYEITGDTRRVCYAPAGAARPTAFVSARGSDHVLVVLQRVK